MVQHEIRTGLALDEFVRRSDEEGAFELIDGAIIPMSPTVFGHSYTIRLLAQLLEKSAGPTWEVFTETTFIRPGLLPSGEPDPDWVEGSLAPDILLISAETLRAYRAATPD